MRERVGVGQVPSERQVQALMAQVVALQEQIAGFTTTLTNADRLATTKMRVGGEKIVAMLAQLAEQHGVTLPAANVAEMLASLTMAQRLQDLADATSQLARRLQDTIMNARSECWWSATALYTSLARVARGDHDIEVGLALVVDFFAIRKRKKPGGQEP